MMTKSKKKNNSNSPLFSFLMLIVISTVMLVYSFNVTNLSTRIFFSSIIYPFQIIFNGIGDIFKGGIESFGSTQDIKQELEITKGQLDQYKKILQDFNELYNENSTLKKMLDLKQNLSYESVTASIIARNPKNVYDIIVLNKGSSSGIKNNMPVISYTSGKRILVGKTIETSPFHTKVLTINNPKFSINGITMKDRITCIVTGSNEDINTAKIDYLPKQYIFYENGLDFVYTSGDSLIFPKGIEIGKIIDVIKTPNYEIYNKGILELSADLSKIEYVLVLKIENSKDDLKLLEIPN